MESIRHNSGSDEQPTSVVRRAAESGDDAYLDAAREAILAVGWSRTTLTDIARRASVSRMTLYRRWPDMQTMLADLMTREWARTVAAAVDPTETDPADGNVTDALARITHGMVATVRALRTNDLLRRIIDLDPELLLPYLLDRRGRSQQQLATMLAQLIAAGQSEGTVRTGDPDTLARTLVLACHGFTLSAHTMVDAEHPVSRDTDVSAFDDELVLLVESYLRP